MSRRNLWKILSLVVLLGLSAVALVPTIRFYSMPPEERRATEREEIRDLRSKALKLGLDLQGGMHLILELDRTTLKDEEVPDAMDRALQILHNRIDLFGVAEPVIQKQGEDRILVQLPGLLDKQRAIDLIGQTAQLEFKLVKTATDTRQVLDRLDRYFAQRGEAPVDTAAADTLDVAYGARPLLDLLYNYPDGMQFGGALVLLSDVPALEALLASADLDSILPRDASVALQTETELVDNRAMRVLYVLNRKAELTGAEISTAMMKMGLDPNRPNLPGVSLTLKPRGTQIFRRVTGANVNRQLAIVLDNKVRSAPFIRDRIPSGQAQITGSFTPDQAGDLAIVLRGGALPAPIRIAEERTVGPSLGRDSVRTGVRAGYVGALVVVLFMLVYYRLSGGVAVTALALNLIFLLAGLTALGFTLTLPGIAGIVLTIGMAVDANVLVFERIREELRNGKRVRAAVDAGYNRAWRTILDANLTTLISAAVLYQFGTGPIKGFAVTLGIGIIANLYTAVLVTRMIFDAFTANRSPRRLSI